MPKPIAIVSGEPNSISSEIIFKAWKLRKKFKLKQIIVVGNINLLNLQKKKLNFPIKIKEINKNFSNNDLKGNHLPILNIKYIQKKPFQRISSSSNKYIFNCFDAALKLINKKKILGLINCPISKEFLFKNKNQGITEFLAQKAKIKNKEVMLIFNKKLSVAPLTTHIPLNQVSRKISKSLIINKIKTIDFFYKKFLKKKPNIAILGLNPHNFSSSKKSEEKKIIIPAIKTAQKNKIKVFGPISPDTSFLISKRYKFDVILGMYHDQVLTPFKTMFKYNAINITIGLPYIRISPDHGVANDIVGKNVANPNSLIESIKFFNYLS